MFLDYLADKKSISFQPSKSEYLFASSKIGEQEFLLIKPSTYVNNSGIAAKHLVDQYSLNTEDLLVIVDDLNLEFPKIRLRLSGGDGGHNGLKSIIYHLNSQNFLRLRIGVGREFKKAEMANFVLSEYSDEELKKLYSVFENCFELIESYLEDGKKAMYDIYSRSYNKRTKMINISNSKS